MKKIYTIIFLLANITIFSADNNQVNFELDKKSNNSFLQILNTSSFSFNDKLKLLYKKPDDKWYPKNDLMVQAYYTYPINRNIGIGPSLYNQNVFYLHDYDKSIISFDSVILTGFSFVFTPFIPSINKPAFFLMIDFGPGVSLNNNYDINSELKVMPGGYSSQVIILPIIPIHLFVMDLNLIAVMATDTPNGIMPGIRMRNHFLLKFAFLNFINKNIKSGVRVKNIFSHILTGKPFTNDLTNEYTYNKLFLSFFWNGLSGLEINSGYGFEYYTMARDPAFHTSNRFFYELSYRKNGFNAGLKHSVIFWSDGIENGKPINEMEVFFGYELSRF